MPAGEGGMKFIATYTDADGVRHEHEFYAPCYVTAWKRAQSRANPSYRLDSVEEAT